MLRGNRFSGWSPLQDTHNSTILSPASTPGFPTRTLQRLSFARRRSTSDPSEQPGILTRAWTKEGSLPTQQRDEEDEEITLERILDGKTKSPASLKDLKAFAGTVDAERRRRGELETVKVLTFLTAYKEYETRFLALPPAKQALSPSPFAIVSEISLTRQEHRRHTSLPHSLSTNSTTSSEFPLSAFPIPLSSRTNKPLPSIPASPSFPSSPNPLANPLSPDPSPSSTSTGGGLKFVFEPTAEGDAIFRAGSPAPFGRSLREALAKRQTGNSVLSEWSAAPSYLSGIPTSVTDNDTFETVFPPPQSSRLLLPRPAPTHSPLSTRRRSSVPIVRATPYLRPPVPSFAPSTTSTILPSTIDPPNQPLRAVLTTIVATFLLLDSPSSLFSILPPQTISQALLEAKYTTHPSVLSPLFAHLSSTLSSTLLPPFLTHASQNLSTSTSHGRLLVSLLSLALSTTLLILLILSPSPMTQTELSRWFRFLCLPFLALGTGFCVVFVVAKRLVEKAVDAPLYSVADPTAFARSPRPTVMSPNHYSEPEGAAAYHEVHNTAEITKHHREHWSHELIGAAAAFAAAKVYEEKQKKAKKPGSHPLAVEIMAALAGAEVDKLIETKGLDFIDREKAKHHAKTHAAKSVTENNY